MRTQSCRVKSLEDRLVTAAESGAERRRCQKLRNPENKEDLWCKKAKQTICWLHEIEVDAARPMMQALAKAEKVSGHRLVVRIDRKLVLCSRGFRIAAPPPVNTNYQDFLPFVDYTTYKLTRRTMKSFGRSLVGESESLKSRVCRVLKESDIKNRLLYQGIDEWPMTAKLFWHIIGIGTCLTVPFLLRKKLRKDYERGMTPVDY